MMKMIIGRHIIAELYGIEKELISLEGIVRDIVEGIVKEAELTKIGSVYRQFNPHGVTGVVLITESHISLHTWPEYRMVNLDIFTCGEFEKAEKTFDLFLKRFKPEQYRRYVLDRG